MGTNKSRRLKNSLKETNGHNVPWVLRACRRHGETSPYNLDAVISCSVKNQGSLHTYHAYWKEYPRLNVVESYVARYLPNGIANCEYCVDLIELISLES